MNRTAVVISLLLLWVLVAGCESQGTPARVHVRVFEVPTQVLRMHLPDERPYKLANSAYCVSAVSPNELNAMLRSNGTQPRLLTERTRVVNDWPAITDTWVYSPSYAGGSIDSLCTGGGIGSVGVRERGQNLQVRLDYMVNHRGPQGQKLIESKIFYEYLYPEGEVLLFHAPADGSQGSSQRHVIAFEVTRENTLPLHARPTDPRPPSGIHAFR